MKYWNFLGTVKNGNKACIWSTTVSLPREISLLDYSSMQMTASTGSGQTGSPELWAAPVAVQSGSQ